MRTYRHFNRDSRSPSWNRSTHVLLAVLCGAAACSKDAGAPVRPTTAIDAGPAVDAGVPKAVTTIRVHYPVGSHTLGLRGSLAPLDWGTSRPLTFASDDTWVFTTSALTSEAEFKPMLDGLWSRGPNYRVAPGATADIYPHFLREAGTFEKKWAAFTSTKLPSTRGIWVYYPPSYAENTLARFPVLYMHDGQNLFDAATSFGGNEWQIDEAMNAGAESGAIRETIVVGIENTADRIAEYTPVPDPSFGGGKGDAYLRMVALEVKPLVDGQLRTLPEREHTAMMGSSLGGLISSYAGVHYPNVFGSVGVMSPSTWWKGRWLIDEVASVATEPARALRVYLDSGDSGTLPGEPGGDGWVDTAALANQYRAVGYVDGVTFKYVLQAGAQHNEIYWAQRAPAALAFLLGPRDP